MCTRCLLIILAGLFLPRPGVAAASDPILAAARRSSPPRARLRVVRVQGNFARVRASLPGADAAALYLRRGSTGWKVIAGPGTGWSSPELDRLAIPHSLR